MDGILIVDKPEGITSHDVVDFVRKKFGLKKVGHGGTLDPIATGVLVILIGRSTRDFPRFVNDDKEYEAGMVLGTISDTGDSEGTLNVLHRDVNYKREELEEVFESFLGEGLQVPPLYSAVKYKGSKLYEYARKGIEVERRPRSITIKSLRILHFEPPEVRFEVTCSKGTYIRQLCVDIGQRLGCGAYLSSLRRIRSGRFSIGDAITMEGLKNLSYSDLANRLIGTR